MNNKNLNLIKNRMSLREPQIESLEILGKIVDKIELTKDYNNEETIKIIHEIAKTCVDFERNFPSICFSLATGVGKTRLMGAFMTYLYFEKGIKNFMVIAPNLTIYNKLIKDFGDTSYEKYVFKGIKEFFYANIVTGENYKKNIEAQTSMSDITINVFNISKINAETKGGKEPQIKRLSEYIGKSYFDYLASQKDLVILMDESHHYRADRGMQVLNELNPVIGLELTATPQVEKGNKTIKFKNVVYEYSLAKAIRDGYVKVPYVATKKNFNPNNYKSDNERDIVKLEDGIRIHEDTKVALDIFARDNKAKRVKPFVLVVAKDTNHAEELLNVIKSDNFFEGYYKDKVIIVHSNQSGAEKDENIEQLVLLENENNKIEIVIHVNMLKEGWDVSNLYTIIPLRTSASNTLTEQTIGRGLRLPYGKITGDKAVDRLTIVSHDKYQAIIDEANKEGSIIRQENIIDIEELDLEDKKEVVTFQNKYIADIEKKESDITSILDWKSNKNLVQDYNAIQAKKVLHDCLYEESAEYNATGMNDYKKEEIKKIVIEQCKKKIEENNQIFINGYNDSVIKSIEENFDNIIEQETLSIIEIPRITIMKSMDTDIIFEDFDLDVAKLSLRPSEQTIIITNLSTNETMEIERKGKDYLAEDLEHTLVAKLWDKPEIDYDKCSELLFKLSRQALNKLNSYLKDNEVVSVIKDYKNTIADYIYAQIKEHIRIKEGELIGTNVKPFSRIEQHNYSKIYKENLYDYHQNIEAKEIKTKIFTGFKKACHSAYKFDSIPEKNLVNCLESDSNVEKWLRPAPNQFNIIWNKYGNNYEPDFIVETNDGIIMVEVKKDTEIMSNDVQEKKKAAIEYCRYATEYNLKNGKKAWKYLIIPASEITYSRNMNEYMKLFYEEII